MANAPALRTQALLQALRRLAGLFALALVTLATAAPQPAPVPKRWQLDIRPGPLRVITLDVPDAGLRTYFYFTYTVVNSSGEDLAFAPTFELSCDDGSIVRSGHDVPPVVYEELLRRLKNPLLDDEISIVGMLLQGEENARDGLVVWPALALKVDEVTIYAAGFSGESKAIRRPDTGQEVILRKTLMLRHATPGDLAGRGDAPLERTERRWIMR